MDIIDEFAEKKKKNKTQNEYISPIILIINDSLNNNNFIVF